jgi:hypothetical protein
MTSNEESPDARFWTTYDHFMFEREARALRNKELLALVRTWWPRTKARILRELKHADTQPVRTRSLPASAPRA